MAKGKLKSLSRHDLFSMHFVPTSIVFLMMMVLIGFSWRTATQNVVDSENQQVSVRSRFIESSILQRMEVYDTAIRGGAGLFESSSNVSRDEWKHFVQNMDLDNRLSGLMGVGFSEFITPARLPAYEEHIRSQGFPDFAVHPQEGGETRDIYTSITFIEPFNERNRNVLGGDMYTEPSRRRAMDQARDSGRSTMTDVTIVRQEDNSTRNGITIFHPVYRAGKPTTSIEERRAAIAGFVYAPIQSAELFGDIFETTDTNFNFQIYDTNQDSEQVLLYEQFPDDQNSPYRWVRSGSLTIDDQNWTIRYGVKDTIVHESIRDRPAGIIFGGTIFAFVVAGIVYLLLQRRSRQLADKEVRRLESAKDSMLSLASHQLRTPATGVKQYVGMVLEGFVGDIDKEQRELLQRAYDSNERQLRIINEFLYMAKADADRIIITPQDFDLIALTKQIVEEMSTEVKDAGHTIRISYRSLSLHCTADKHSTRMIIENLISNAVKYTPAGGKIKVALRRKGKFAIVAVSDTGVGIAEQDMPRLFQQFSRIPNELTKMTAGSGIGLYLARYLARLNGGKITVESVRGKGSTFTAYFPHKSVKKVTDENQESE